MLILDVLAVVFLDGEGVSIDIIHTAEIHGDCVLPIRALSTAEGLYSAGLAEERKVRDVNACLFLNDPSLLIIPVVNIARCLFERWEIISFMASYLVNLLTLL